MARNRTQPTHGKLCSKVPQVMQMETMECGAACLAMICAYYGKWIPLEQVRKDCGINRDGSKANKIVRAARAYGFHACGYAVGVRGFDDVLFPAIIHWDFNHFVVLRGIRNDKAYISDPARGELKIPLEDFREHYTGVLLQFEPTTEFEPSGKKPSVGAFLQSRLSNSISELIFVIMVTALVSILGLISPLLSQVFIDKLIGKQSADLVAPFFTILIVVGILQIICSALSSFYLHRVQGKLTVMGSASFMWKLFRLPIDFFSQRSSGDLTDRIDFNTSIASTIVTAIGPIFIQLITAFVCLALLISYNVLLAVIVFAASLLKLVLAQVVNKKRTNFMRVMVRDDANLSTSTVAGFKLIESLKASGATRGFFTRWSGYQASSNTQWASLSKLTYNTWGLLPNLVGSLLDATIVVVGVYLIMQGQFTIGALSAFQGVLTQFAAPLTSLISAMESLKETAVNMERIQDVMDYPDDDLNAIDSPSNATSKLSGEIHMDHVTFGYSHLEEPLIEDFNLEVKSGGSIALVGPSGCGKSTLAKLVAGLYAPWSGVISFDGTPLRDIPRDVKCASVAVVDQDIVLFGDASIRENLCLFDETIPEFTTIMAAHDVDMHDVIMERPDGYNYRMKENGNDFSGGQRQRLEIARALSTEPTILVLDEATSALDTKTELNVMESVRANGITTILVTHRLSAIRDCDEIIVMNHGKIVQRGTHDQLVSQGGLYTKLVTQE